MQIHQLQRQNKNKRPKARIGRGGKRGSYSGRGVKGQKARAGHRIRPAMRDFIQRLPKFRGQGNSATRVKIKPVAVSVGSLEKKFAAGAKITAADFRAPVKILNQGKLTKALTVKGLAVSKAARAKIEATGGRVES